MGVKFEASRMLAATPKPSMPGQHHVEDHEVELARRPGVGEAGEGLGAVARHLDLVAFQLEVELDAEGEVLFVLDDEDARHLTPRGGPRGGRAG